MRAETYGAADFKANCLAILDRLARRDLDSVTITKRGRAVAVLTPPESQADVIDGPQSVVWDEAENRMHVQKALMEFLLLGQVKA